MKVHKRQKKRDLHGVARLSTNLNVSSFACTEFILVTVHFIARFQAWEGRIRAFDQHSCCTQVKGAMKRGDFLFQQPGEFLPGKNLAVAAFFVESRA